MKERIFTLAVGFLLAASVARALIGSEHELFVGNYYDSLKGYAVAGVNVINSAGVYVGGVSGTVTGTVSGTVTGTVTGTTTGSVRPTPPAAEAIIAAATVTANGCGSIKRIDSVGAVTTGTTNTFTAPAAANAGCEMDVCNDDAADTITLDNNALFESSGGADVALAPAECVRVGSDGLKWRQLAAKVLNHA